MCWKPRNLVFLAVPELKFIFLSQLAQEAFLEELHKVVTSRQKMVIKKDEGWYSEHEMKTDLKWSP